MAVSSAPLIEKGVSISGSAIGSPAQIERMFQLAIDMGINTYYQKFKFNDINQAFSEFEEGKPRFRFVLVNEENGGEM
jgi:alcohol dehydrogenase (NADP+)